MTRQFGNSKTLVNCAVKKRSSANGTASNVAATTKQNDGLWALQPSQVKGRGRAIMTMLPQVVLPAPRSKRTLSGAQQNILDFIVATPWPSS